MALRLTPDMLAAAYDFLRTTEPFRRWKLPRSDEVEFRVGRAHDCYGWYERINGTHTIMVSGRWIGHTVNLVRVMAHEKIHLHQNLRGLETPNTLHNADFHRRGALVCKHHGFDPRMF